MSISIIPHKIVVAICTRERPKMLSEILETLTQLEMDSQTSLLFIIIENGPLAASKDIIESFRKHLSIEYYHQPIPGLVSARNTAVEKCLETKAKWFAFFDDDHKVDPEWLLEMLIAREKYPAARAFAGPIFRIPAAEATKWYPPPRDPKCQTGKPVWDVETGNILLNRDLFSKDGDNLRFDPRFNLTGGEDMNLFARMKQKKIQILWVQNAYCTEKMLPSRATLSARIARSIRNSHCSGFVNQDQHGAIIGRIYNLFIAFRLLVHCISYALIGTLVLIFHEKPGIKLLGTALQKGSLCIGRLYALVLPLEPAYQNVDGY